MRDYVEIAGQKIFLVGKSRLNNDSDDRIPYYEIKLSDGGKGEFLPVMDTEEEEGAEQEDYIFVDGVEYVIKSEI